MALVAATTVGLDAVQRVRAEVSVGGHELLAPASDEYRLIVQSYAANKLVDGVPIASARPLASAQRSVTAEELARGIAVDVVGVGERAADFPMIVAWLERGTGDLEFDAHRARPGRGAYVGVAATQSVFGASQAHVVLSRKVG
jgi:hypothetical protein